MRELREGIGLWQAPHPEWKPDSGWPELVNAYAVDDGACLLLIDPLALPEELEARAAGREVEILLTCHWHVRDAPALAERLGATIHVPQNEAGVDGLPYRAGDALPGGVRAMQGMEDHDLLLWLEGHRTLISGDSLIDRGDGLVVPSEWIDDGRSRDEVLAALRPLLELPVDLVLPTHGEPTDRAALERALA